MTILLELKRLVSDFFKLVTRQNIEIYNEFSLQHELGIFLREALPTYKVQFERNITFFLLTLIQLRKKLIFQFFRG